MAEAIAALGVAANILQMLDYGGQFVNAAWKMWNSNGENTGAFSTIRTLSKDLEDVLRVLQSTEQPPNNTRVQSSEANAILQLSNECAVVTSKILEGLQKSGLSGSTGKREAVKAAFKQVWNGGEIKALEVQLGEFRAQLTLRLLVSMRSYATKSVDYQWRILEQLDQSQADNRELHKKIDNLHSHNFSFGISVVSYIVHAMGSNASDGLAEALQGDLLGAMYDGVASLDRDNVSAFVLDERRKRRLEKAFLSALSYEGMLRRATMVAEAHQATLQWVFHKREDQPWVDLPSWLGSSEQLYWITGKPGAGKSTLMKFLTQPIRDVPNSSEGRDEEANHLRCAEHLRNWAGEKPLIIATFYFWAAGSKIQTTRAALFRTLLYQILSKRPDALPIASPNRWEVLCLFDNDQRAFREDELREMLLRTLSYVSRDSAISLFVDGLDEFAGDHDELTRFFKHVIDRTSIKMCMASRPWPVFEDAFQNKPGLRMEDLTYQDIKGFVTAKFQEDSGFSQLQRREADFASKLIEEVVQKASGVFLWVRLAVSSLLEGMKFGDRISDLRRRLGSLPPDLKDLYDRILDDLDPFYFGHAAQYFQILSSSSDPPPALLLWFTDEEQVDLALRLPVMAMSDEDVQIRLDTMRRRVNSRCKGLIEVARPDNGPQTTPSLRTPVQYLHATVKDYIESPKIQERLLRELGTTFDPYLSLCSGSFAMYKVSGRSWIDFSACMRYASYINPRNVQHMTAILDDLAQYFLPLGSIPGHPFQALFIKKLPPLPEADEDHILTCMDETVQTFLSLAVKCDVVEYVERRMPPAGLATVLNDVNPRRAVYKLPTTKRKLFWTGFRHSMKKWKIEGQEPQVGWPLLLDAIQLQSTAASASMVAVLLENGANPNRHCKHGGFDKSTIWTRTLGLVVRVFTKASWDPQGKSRWAEITRLMLANGAHTDRKTIKLAVASALGDAKLPGDRMDKKAIVIQTQQTLKSFMDKGAPMSFDFIAGV